MSESCILLFVKYPVEGMVKTRLGRSIGDEFACELYHRFVLDILRNLKKTNRDIIVCFDPYEKQSMYVEWLGDEHAYLPQSGDDIGNRMKNALVDAFGFGYNKAVLIGSDSPDLPTSVIGQSFDVLNKNNAVIGPSADGGYYLIGFNSDNFLPQVFDAIKWSSDEVFDDTMKIFLANEEYPVFILDKWYDIDTASDLEGLLKRNQRTSFRNSRTYEYLINKAAT